MYSIDSFTIAIVIFLIKRNEMIVSFLGNHYKGRIDDGHLWFYAVLP